MLVVGPLVGGLLVQRSTWRWCFYINLPFCAGGLILVHFFVRFQTKRSSLREKLLRVDWIGGFLFISGLTSFLMGTSWAGVQFPWSSFRTIVPIAAGAGGVLLSLVWERYGARRPPTRGPTTLPNEMLAQLETWRVASYPMPRQQGQAQTTLLAAAVVQYPQIQPDP